jgi:hypothetical protein
MLSGYIRTQSESELFEPTELTKTGRGNFRNVLLESEFAVEQNAKIPNCADCWLDVRGINTDTLLFACHFD